ncbi:MAG: helix-turn-helix transcriptional regulator [Deltaproteobacteria bacterium]|nr:helix-turn-helix transcriptional regulator [Deltaproteobacteria bacterium]
MDHKKFKKIRLELGLTQQQFADRLRTNIRQVQRWENGETKITGPTSIAVELLLAVKNTDIGKQFGL